MDRAWPPCSTTGVGSLPFTEEADLRAAVRLMDLPYLPEPLNRSADEGLVARALRGRAAGAPDLSSLSRWLPAEGPFKAQWCGPTTLAAYGALSPAEAVEWCRALVAATTRPGLVLFFDEPGLATHEAVELTPLITEARARGVSAIGVHCCGETDWDRVLSWPLDFIGIDVRRSLDSVVERPAWRRYVERGGALALGAVPTAPGERADLGEVCEGIEAALRSRTPNFAQVLHRSLVTTACGLGLHSPEAAWEAIRSLAEVRARLLAACA